jgi:hypothetical protein
MSIDIRIRMGRAIILRHAAKIERIQPNCLISLSFERAAKKKRSRQENREILLKTHKFKILPFESENREPPRHCKHLAAKNENARVRHTYDN